jgi:uncharacterized membrane protein
VPVLQLFLFLHVMGAIVVFGPTVVFPILARFARQNPQHAHFAAEVSHFIESRLVMPGIFVQAATGIGLILIIGADLTSPAYRWLVAGIILYVIAIIYSVAVQGPAAAKMVELTAGGPPPVPAGGAPGAGAPAAGAPAGPPPELIANAQKLQRGGMFLSALLVLIVILMVTKPGY